jgi:hypothetical protein
MAFRTVRHALLCDPELALGEVAARTHYDANLPRLGRKNGNDTEIRPHRSNVKTQFVSTLVTATTTP